MHGEPVHPAALHEGQLLRVCRIERLRHSGPGGQHRNKVETGIRIIHTPTGLKSEAFERRHQELNRAEAVWRLRLVLAVTIRCPLPPAHPSDLWLRRIHEGRILCSAEHEDFPALLAEALDTLAALTYDVTRAATELHCTASQLVKLLKAEPRALQVVNRERRSSGLRPLL